ncbi:MAG: transcription termination factor Rho [Eggerthellaceae bacterium]|jgi:transcription termination factor Rho
MSDEAVVETAATAEAPSEAAPKPATRRRSTRTKAEKTAAEAVAAQAEAAPEAPAKPRRTRRTKAQIAADEAKAAAEAAAQAGEAPAAPKTRTRAKAAKAADQAEQDAPAEKPARRTRTRTRAAAAAEPAAPAEAAEAAKPAAADKPAEPAGEQAAEAPRPRQRRARRTKTVVIEPPESSAAADEAADHEQGHANHRRDDNRAARASKTQRDVRPGRAERNERNDRSDRNDRNDRNERNDRSNRANNNQRQNNNQRNNGNNNRRNNNGNNKHQRNNREVQPSVTLEELSALKVAELRERAATLELDVAGMKKAELVDAVYHATLEAEGFREVSGILDIIPDGYGFVRTQGYLPSETDCYVGMALIKRCGLRKGDLVTGQTHPGREKEKYAAIHKITSVNGLPVDQSLHRPRFADLTPIYPQDRLWMEHGKNTMTARVIDLVAPIGKGQRGLIVSPPKAGKTTVLKNIAAAISANNPEVHLMCLLIDERPEEVTDMRRSIKGEVISSTFDMPAENHIAVAEMVIERAKRLVEQGEDVVILLDSITRLARAYNLAQPASGRVLSGGVDSTALYPPKRFLGAARNIENGGSLTILASALIDTGSKMDEVIFEEFKGTGNMELRLDRSLADRRIFPAIDPVTSGTRKEELLIDPQMAPLIWAVRRILANMNNTERAMDMLIKSLKRTETNQEFLMRAARKAQHSAKFDSLEF